VTALFGEKYGEFVRVLEVGNFSRELCGGTHIGRSSEIGFLKITAESSVGANLRRIEAVTSFDAYDVVMGQQAQLAEMSAITGSSRKELVTKVTSLVSRVKDLEQQLKRASSASVTAEAASLAESLVAVPAGYRAAVVDLGAIDGSSIKSVWDRLRDQGAEAVVVFGTDEESGKLVFIAAAADSAVEAGFNAGNVVKTIAGAIGGRGGGKPTMAQGGAEDASRIDEAMSCARGALGL
jgi:alanyl-tRNA synthetase